MTSITRRFDRNNFSISALPFLLNGDNFSLDHINAPSSKILNITFKLLSKADSPKIMALNNSCKPVQ